MLPEDDRDLSMARRLGARLDQRVPLDRAGEDEPSDDASFYQALVSFKQTYPQETPPAGASARVWAAIEQQIEQDPATPAAEPNPATRPRPALRLVRSLAASRAARTWLAAASVLVLVAAGWLLWGRAPAPVLLASADAAIVTYTTPDGSVVRLRPHSQLYAIDEEAARYRLEGEGFFEVTKNEARTFTVEAGDARIEVLGTRFNVSTWGTQTAVFLEEGRIRFEHMPSRQIVELTPGQQSHASVDEQVMTPGAADSSEYKDWLQQEMTFARRPLHQVFDELAHHYAIAFEAPAAWQNETVTGRILLDGRQQSLDDLGVILEGRFVSIDDKTYRFVPD